MIPTPSKLTRFDSGGGRELDASGRMLRTKDQDQNSRQYRAVKNAFERKVPVSVVIGETASEGIWS